MRSLLDIFEGSLRNIVFLVQIVMAFMFFSPQSVVESPTDPEPSNQEDSCMT